MKDSLDSFSSTESLGPLEFKLLEAIEQNHHLQNKLKNSQDLYTEKLDQFELKINYLSETKNLLEQTLSALESKKAKIKALRKELEKKNVEISDLSTTIKLQKDRINSLRKTRQQSVDLIKDLEEELSQTKKLNNTPTNAKLASGTMSSEKKIPPTKELKTQTFSFNINEVSEYSYNKDTGEQERLIEEQSKLLNEERNKNMKLENKIELLKNESFCQESKLGVLQEKMNEFERKFRENNVFWMDRIEKYKMKNNELIEKIKEYQERESELNNTSDCETGNLHDELSGLNTSQRSRLFEKNSQDDLSSLGLKCTDSSLEMNEVKQQLVKLNSEVFDLRVQNDRLKKDIEKRAQTSAELNRILAENKRNFEVFRNRFSFQNLSQDVLKLNLLKQKLSIEIEEYRKELLNLTEKIIQKKVMIRRPCLDDICSEVMYETPARVNPPKIKFSENRKKRRNISWGYDLLNLI